MITREEYELLKQYRAKGYSYLSRDKDNLLCVNMYKPRKLNERWSWGTNDSPLDGDNLKCVRWEDEKPTKIDDLIQDYESHQIITSENANKTELIKEIDNILDDIGVSDYQLGECDEDTIWTISSITIREILSAIEKHSPISVSEKVKVTVPQFVGNWIEEVKALKRSFKLEILFDTTEMPDEVFDWLDERYGDTDILAKAWLHGFVVEKEKEKLYLVALLNYQRLSKIDDTIKFMDIDEWFVKDLKTQLTQAEIESVDPRLMQFAEEVE